MPPARTYWAFVAVFAAFFGFITYKGVGPRAERVEVELEIVELPREWKALPVVGRATPEVVTPHPGSVDHDWTVGPFALHRAETTRSGSPRFDVKSARARQALVVEMPPPFCSPDVVHEDKDADVFVLAQGERACAAIKAKRLPSARPAGKLVPLFAGIISAAAVLLIAAMVRKLK
jgi:hypothetical protein